MPVYEYRCSRGHHYEKVEGFQAPPEHACPHCGGAARRQLSVPAVIFKGPGFYSTENRRSASPESPQDSFGGDGASGNGGFGDDSASDHGSAAPKSEAKATE